MGRRLLLALISTSLLLGLAPVTETAIAKKARHAKHRASPPFSSDTAADPSPLAFWGEIHCVHDGRHQFVTTGGDPHPTITGEDQGNESFRRLSVVDGDDFWGERCELGEEGSKGPTTVYREGTRWITQMSVRLPTAFPLGAHTWQAIMQMKSTGTESSTGTPALELDAYDGYWRLRQSISRRVAYDSRELWAAPATPGRWTRFSFDIRYSRKPWLGSITVSADLNADGDFLDPGEQSGTMRTYTLKVELRWGERDGVKPGQSIPSHLRAGVYHDEEYSCPSPTGCYVDLDNVQLLRAGA
jgi:hypothetical protein